MRFLVRERVRRRHEMSIGTRVKVIAGRDKVRTSASEPSGSDENCTQFERQASNTKPFHRPSPALIAAL